MKKSGFVVRKIESEKAIIVLHDNIEGDTKLKNEILSFCEGRIARYKLPRSIEFIRDDEMPRSATGKILHRKLRDLYHK